MKRHSVRVSRRIGRKVSSAANDLAELGVQVRSVQSKRKAKNGAAAWSAVSHLWLLFSIGREAFGAWPKIRKALKDVGLRRDEITTLGLSQYTHKPTKKKASTKKKRRAT